MTRSPRVLLATIALLVVAVLVVSWPDSAPAQDPGEGGTLIVVNPGDKTFPIAIPAPVLPGGDPSGVASTVYEVVVHDLELTGYFDIIDPAAYIEAPDAGVEPDTFTFDPWRKIKAGALAKTRIQPLDGQIAADVFIYDVPIGEKLSAKRFMASAAEARYLGHKIADEILMTLTGKPGFFATKLVAVGTRTGNKEIYVMDIDGAGVSGVSRNGSINLSPAWSPDGGMIAWTSYKRGNPDLYAKELSTGRTRVLSNREGLNTGAAFSPDGSKLALARSTGGDSDIYVIETGTGADVTRVTTGGGIDVAPNFSPDGRWIAFSSERSGGSQVFIQSVTTGEAKRVTFSGTFNTDPVFSPDGTKIAFVGRTPKFNIFVVDIDGSGMYPVTQDQGDNEDPSWSPDGRYITFSSTRSGKSEIWISTADGRHQMALTPGSGGWTQPAWSPQF